MKPYQTLNDGNYQVVLFPLEVLHVTQGIGGLFSHAGSYAMDFVGLTPRSQLYAPCDLNLVASEPGKVVYTSLRPVKFANGVIGYFTIRMLHDDDTYTPPRVILQGQPIAKTGTTGYVTGDHVHIETKSGFYEGTHQNSEGVWMMTNSAPPFHFLAINNTVEIDDGGYVWIDATSGLPMYLY